MQQYLVELNESITNDDLKNIRLLYLPIIGTKAIALYSVLVDQAIAKFKIDFNDEKHLLQSLRLSIQELAQIRKILEAVGLLKTYKKLDQPLILLIVLKPLNINGMMKNKLLWNRLHDSLGEHELERLVFANQTQKIDKNNFIEISTKYYEIFDVNRNDKRIVNTASIPVPKFANKQEACKHASAEMFYKFLTNSAAKPSILKIFNDLRNIGFTNQAINLIQNYTFLNNDKIVAKYLETIAYDLFNKEIILTQEIEKELRNALENKKQQATKQQNLKLNFDNETETDLDKAFSDLFS